MKLKTQLEKIPRDKDEIRDIWLKHLASRESIPKRNSDALIHLNYIGKYKQIHHPSRILDLGSGIGIVTHFMAKRGHESYGLEIDKDVIKLATQKEIHEDFFSEKTKFINSDAEKLPFKDGVFDLCFLNSLLEHVIDWECVLKETVRVLKVGGALFLVTTNRACPFQAEVNNFPFYPWIPQVMKKRILKYIMEKRRGLVNWTDRPAIHWFTYSQLKDFFSKERCVSYELLQLLNPDKLVNKGFKNWRKHLLKIFQKHGFLYPVFHILKQGITLLIIKK